jgi:NADH:ubiquinone oxidoreductase subunit
MFQRWWNRTVANNGHEDPAPEEQEEGENEYDGEPDFESYMNRYFFNEPPEEPQPQPEENPPWDLPELEPIPGLEDDVSDLEPPPDGIMTLPTDQAFTDPYQGEPLGDDEVADAYYHSRNKNKRKKK